MNQSGFILLHRSILNWEWYGDINVRLLFIHLLLKANHAERNWKGEIVNRGQHITSLSTLSAETGLSIKVVRTSLKKLEKSGELGTQTGKQWTRITINNYDSYQAVDNTRGTQKGKQRAHDGHTMGTQRAHDGQQTINDNELNNDNSLKELNKGLNFITAENGGSDSQPFIIEPEKVIIEDQAKTPPDEPKKLTPRFTDAFVKFYLGKVGLPYKFTGAADGKAAKEIIDYIRKAQKEKSGRDPTDEEILNGWQFILNSYGKWEPFYQAQMKLYQINSNLPNIMANIKGITKNGKSNGIDNSPAAFTARIREAVEGARKNQ